MARVVCGIHNSSCVILSGSDPLSNLRPLGNLLLVAKKFVDVGNADSRTDSLHPDVTDSWNQVLKQSNLALIAGREVGVPAFRAVRLISRTIPSEEGFTQSGARCD